MASRTPISAGQSCEPVFDSYARLSWNPSTHELEKIDTQHHDNDTTIQRHGGRLGLRLDDGLSAWKRDVRRPGFERLLERAGRGESQGIAVWHVDRLFRQPRDLEKLIDLADRGFRVISSHGARDLSDPDDRYILRIEVAHAARSSDDASRRIRRRLQDYRERGRPAGRPGFGFERIDRSTRMRDLPPDGVRPSVTAELVVAERVALREAVDDLLAGRDTQVEIARRWNRAGLWTPEGNEWDSISVRDTLSRPLLAGRIEHDGQLVSRVDGESIVDEGSWLRLRAMIIGRRRGRPYTNQHLASGIALCGACGRPLSGRAESATGRASYRCNKQRRGCGRIDISLPRVDAELRALTIARLSDPRHAEAITAVRSQVSDRLAAVLAEIDQIESLARALSERVGRREMSLADFDNSYRFLQDDLAPLVEERDQLRAIALGDGTAGVLSEGDVAEEWDGAETTADRRALLREAIGSDQLRILPARQHGKRVFDAGRVILVAATEPLLVGPTS
jgi:DNA invertase Pin-like site-specific DNA recombinase